MIAKLKKTDDQTNIDKYRPSSCKYRKTAFQKHSKRYLIGDLMTITLIVSFLLRLFFKTAGVTLILSWICTNLGLSGISTP